jgi:hypothetical protein
MVPLGPLLQVHQLEQQQEQLTPAQLAPWPKHGSSGSLSSAPVSPEVQHTPLTSLSRALDEAMLQQQQQPEPQQLQQQFQQGWGGAAGAGQLTDSNRAGEAEAH